jgi:hypothetical protein
MRRVLTACLLAAACGGGPGTSGPPDAGPPDAGELTQGEVARGLVAINELVSNPASGPDWIELRVTGDQAVDVSGWFLSDAPDRLDHFFELPTGTVIQPGQYLVIAADDGATGAPFKLSREDGVVLLDPDGRAVDVLLYLAPETEGVALARVPDGEGRFVVRPPTPGAANP